MHRLKRIAAAVAVAGSLTVGGVATAAPAEAAHPIPGMPGCYMYNFYDYMYLFHGVYGWCSSDTGPIYFDGDGRYW